MQRWSWTVWCKNDNTIYESGYADSEKEATRLAKAAGRNLDCNPSDGSADEGISISIESQFIDDLQSSINALIVNGTIEYLDIIDRSTNESRRFSPPEISANALAWLSEIWDYDEATLTTIDKVIAQLKVWDVYLGGNTMAEILPLHNLTAEQFHAIATKSWNKITIKWTEKDNGTVRLGWIFDNEEPEPTRIEIQVIPVVVHNFLTVQFSMPINAMINVRIVGTEDETHLDLDTPVIGKILSINVDFLPSGNYVVVCTYNDYVAQASFLKQ